MKTSTKSVVKTALLTALIAIILTVVITAIVFLAAPLEAYKFTRRLGMKDAALWHAQRYADGGNIDGLVYCVELDDELLRDKQLGKYALNLIAHTQKFYEFQDIESYFAQIDKYYIENAPIQTKVLFYSYNEYLVSENYFARTLVGSDDEMLLRGVPTPLNELFSNDLDLVEQATVFSALSKAAYNRTEFAAFVDDDRNITPFLKQLTEIVPLYVARLNEEYDVSSPDEQLKTLFLMRCALRLVLCVNDFLDGSGLPNEWKEFSSLKVGDKDISNAYSELYLAYIRS